MRLPDSIPGRWAAVVRQFPDHVAVVEPGGETWSYRQLDERSHRVARGVREAGVTPGSPVALLGDPGAPVVAAILGVLKAGHPYLHLDPAEGDDRLRARVQHSGTGLIWGGARHLERARPLAEAAGVRRLDETGLPAAGPDSGWDEPAPGAAAWILYTSGSTGEPKAVWQTHAGVLHHTDVYRDLIGLGPEDRLSLLTSLSLAASATALFGALLNGAALCPFALREQGVDRMVRWLAGQRITVWHTVPTVLRQGLRSSGGSLRDSALRWVRLGGEAVLSSDVELLRREGPSGVRLLHAYSSTETGLTCALVVGPGDAVPPGRVPVGRPVPGVSIEVVDEAHRPVPVGTPGRIVVRSAGVAPGYWRGRAESGEPFLPGDETDGRRRFVTSDLGCLGADRTLTHLGRMDQQVKIRGRRVDLAEVESLVAAVPGVREVAVTVVDGPGGSPSLVALVVPEPGQHPGPGAVQRHWGTRLPGAVFPDEVVSVERLPVAPGGKLDRRAMPGLAAPARGARPVPAPAAGGGRPARDWFEKELAAIWADVLQVPRVARGDDFFDLGGSSLESARVLARIEDRYGLTLPPSTLAEHPTVEQLARVVGARTVKQDGQPLVILRSDPGDRLPVFLAHGGKGDVAMYGQLSRRLGERIVGAFQSAGLAGERWPLMSVPAMAAHYLEALRRARPTGPVVLGGSCMGGLIALEMAHRLHAEGREVAEVLLIDTDYPAPAGRRLRRVERIVSPVRDGFRILRWGFLRAVGVGRRPGWLPAYHRFVSAMNSRARRRYRVQPYPGRVTLFLGTINQRPGPDLRRRMESAAAEVRIIPVEGQRARLLLPPGVEGLAEALARVLAEADARHAGVR